MPDKFITLDVGFPSFSGGESTEEKVDAILNYQYQLQESLRYMLRHLDRGNFDEAGLLSITEPISLSLREDFNSMKLEIDAGGMAAVIEGLESTLSAYVRSDVFQVSIEALDGDISTLRQTVNSFSTRIETAEGNASTALQTANSFSTRIETAEGNASTALQTANGFATRISTAEGNISSLQQTASSLSSRISTADGKISTLQQTVNGFTLSVSGSDGTSIFSLKSGNTTISSQKVDLYVKAANIYGTLKANQIETGALSADRIQGNTIYINAEDGSTTGYFYPVDTSLGDGLMLQGSNGLKMASWNGNVYIRSHLSYADSSNAPAIVMQWQNDDPLRGTIQLIGGALVLDSKSFGSSLPSDPVYGQVYFLV